MLNTTIITLTMPLNQVINLPRRPRRLANKRHRQIIHRRRNLNIANTTNTRLLMHQIQNMPTLMTSNHRMRTQSLPMSLLSPPGTTRTRMSRLGTIQPQILQYKTRQDPRRNIVSQSLRQMFNSPKRDIKQHGRTKDRHRPERTSMSPSHNHNARQPSQPTHAIPQ